MEACIACGVDHVGLNFVPESPRFVDFDTAEQLANMARGKVHIVGVFRNQSREQIVEAARRVKLDAVQLHGNETPQLCLDLPYPVWKAFGVSFGWDAALPARYRGVAVRLFDTASSGLSGGIGKTFDWSLLPSQAQRPWYLAGGLSQDNILAALEACHPDGVDLNSGVEIAPGQKSPERISAMMDLLSPWRNTTSAPRPGKAGEPLVIGDLAWAVWELPARKPPGDQEALWILELLQVHGGRLVVDARLRDGDPSDLVSHLMGLQMAARGRGGRLKFRLSDRAMHVILSASLATVLELVD